MENHSRSAFPLWDLQLVNPEKWDIKTNHLVPGSRLGLDYTTDKRASAMPSQGSLFTNFEDVQLTDEERVYLNAAYLGDVGVIRESVEASSESNLNVNCVDYMGRNSLHLAIDSEKLDVIEILLDTLSFRCIEEALLHAISKGATKVVKIIIEHPNFMAGEDKLRRMAGGEAFFRTEEKSQFPPDITPLILAAHYNNHEIIQMFLSRNHKIEKPHSISCNCTDCVTKQNYDSLKRSRSRLNAYRALASPAYMALSSPDPIMTTFELRQEMMKLSDVEKEFKSDYMGLLEQCMKFACELMDLCRGTQEVEAVLSESGDTNQRDPLARLKMAIRYEEKKFVAHPNCQQHMTSIWYGSEMGFLQSTYWFRKCIYLLLFLPAIPFLCLVYVFAPNSKLGAVMRCPVTKFITHTTSHICFLVLLSAATFRLTEHTEHITTPDELHDPRYSHLTFEVKVQVLLKETLRPASTLITHVQICIVFWILGLLWIECKQVYNSGARSYITDYYNFMDFAVLAMYLASYVLRFFTEYKVSEADRFFNGTIRARDLLMSENYTGFLHHVTSIKDPSRWGQHNYFMEASRFQWEADDPEIFSDLLFAIANVISFARTTYLMPAFEVLGPLQISLARMIGDITRFMVLFTLVLFAFMVGLHNLYWYYGARKIKMTLNGNVVSVHAAKAFQGLRQTFYSLFWSMFGQVSINDIIVQHPKLNGVRECVSIDLEHNRIYCSDDSVSGEYTVAGLSQGPELELLTTGSIRDQNSANTPVYVAGNPTLESSTAIVEGVGTVLFGIYHVVIIIVLINMLIAMMSHSFEDIQTDCDVEWKFARTKLWLNYMDDGSTLPAPFNMIPTPKSFCYGWSFCQHLWRPKSKSTLEYNKGRKQTFLKCEEGIDTEWDERRLSSVSKKRRETVCKNLELKPDDTSYTDIMHRLVKRYLFKLERAKDEKENVMKEGGVGGMRSGEEVELIDASDTPPPVPDTPRRIPYATPPIQEEEEEGPKLGLDSRQQQSTRRKGANRPHLRRTSMGTIPISTTLAIPQLDAIQRCQKLLDVRLQHLQANSKENNRLQDDVEFIRRLMTEHQKALCNVVQALANIQGEIVNLAQALRPEPRKPPSNALPNAHAQSNAVASSKSSYRKKSGPVEDESNV